MPKKAPAKNQSAGLLLFRKARADVQVLLGHPGGPFWSKKDLGAWTIPKGLIASGESPLAAAKREFGEETGHQPSAEVVSLGDAKQPGGKVVHVWAVQGDWDADQLLSNTFEMEWPPKSGRRQTYPELDRAGWFSISEARQKMLKGQQVFLDRLLALGDHWQAIDHVAPTHGTAVPNKNKRKEPIV
jgi:predicted NUDIX family NTP pyrophosphohydrolase